MVRASSYFVVVMCRHILRSSSRVTMKCRCSGESSGMHRFKMVGRNCSCSLLTKNAAIMKLRYDVIVCGIDLSYSSFDAFRGVSDEL